MFDLIKKIFTGPDVDFKKLVNDGAVIIDVRSPGEYHEGHISGARNIPLEQIKNYATEFKTDNNPVVLYCRSGNRSQMALNILKQCGVANAYNGGSIVNIKALLN